MIKLVGYNWQSSFPWFIKTYSVLVWQQNAALSKSVIANNVILIINILIIRTSAVLCSYIVLLVIKSLHNLHMHVHLFMSCTKWNYTAINMLFETKKNKVNWLNMMKSYMCCFSTVFWEIFKIVRNRKDALQCKRGKTYCIFWHSRGDFKNDNIYSKYWIKNLNKWLTRQACNLKVYGYLYKMGQFKNTFVL